VYLNKILPLFLSPIVVVLALIVASMLLRKRGLAALAALFLCVASLPVVADRLLLLVQGDLVRLQPQDVPRREAVVVLAGSLGYTQGRGGPMPEWGSSIDRIFAGIELMQAARAERVVFSSGDYVRDDLRTEGQLAREFALAMGVDDSSIVLSDKAANTADEARLIRPVFTGARPTIILVTSASHMPRATAIFAEAGFEVTPYPVDIDIPLMRRWHDAWLPDARALLKTDTAVRELLGQAYYRVMFVMRGEPDNLATRSTQPLANR
jgi:uncharacterized SAM-binding protein YcdF (DUF218 family)